MAFVATLWPYMVPLYVVYLSEYIMQVRCPTSYALRPIPYAYALCRTPYMPYALGPTHTHTHCLYPLSLTPQHLSLPPALVLLAPSLPHAATTLTTRYPVLT
eukprot:1209934-Rhodomonas_salina.1